MTSLAIHSPRALAETRRTNGDALESHGHASIATTVDLYGHLDLSDVARDLALIDSLS
jgi:hypothetical protein